VENATRLKYLFEQGMIEGFAELNATDARDVDMGCSTSTACFWVAV
jgi:hypothetical protein